MNPISFKRPSPASPTEAFAAMIGVQPVKNDIQMLPIDQLIAFEGQPFKPYPPDKLKELSDDIVMNGMHYPVIVRPFFGKYQILSGHNRTNAAKLAGLHEVPCFIKELDDDNARLLMLNTNLNQRDELLPSEKAFAYKMQMDVMKRQTGRPSKENGSQLGNHSAGTKSGDILAAQAGESKNQIFRYIRLTYLIKPLMDMVDAKELSFGVGVNLSYLADSEQVLLCQYMHTSKGSVNITIEQSQLLREYSQNGGIGYTTSFDEIFGTGTARTPSVAVKKKTLKIHYERLEKYIEPDVLEKDAEEYIIEALEFYKTHMSSIRQQRQS